MHNLDSQPPQVATTLKKVFLFTKQPLWPLSYVGKTRHKFTKKIEFEQPVETQVFSLGLELDFKPQLTICEVCQGSVTRLRVRSYLLRLVKHDINKLIGLGTGAQTTRGCVHLVGICPLILRLKRKETSVYLYDPYEETQLGTTLKEAITAVFSALLFVAFVTGLFLL